MAGETPIHCPFCGAQPILFQAHLTHNISVQCMNEACGVRPYTRYCETAGEAIRAWNTRADNFTAPSGGVPEAQDSRRQEDKLTPANS